MDKIRLGNFALIKMRAEEYDAAYDADSKAQYGEKLDSIVWIEQYDAEDEIVAMSAENLLVFCDKTFAHTSRHTHWEGNFYTCLKAILNMEQV